MKLLSLLFLLGVAACPLSSRALEVPDDLTLAGPFTRRDAVRVDGTLTLSSPGDYSAAEWNIRGSLRLSAPGNYTFAATAGGIVIAGNILGPSRDPATVTMNYVTTFSYHGATGVTVTIIDGPTSPEPPQPGVASSAPLANISTRATLANTAPLNPGFVIGGTAQRRVLIRAIGPGLRAFDVSNPAPAPTLKIYSGSQQIAENSGWGGDPSLVTVMAGVGAFALDPASKDAVLLLTLAPGNYTATVTGPGEILFEVYFVD